MFSGKLAPDHPLMDMKKRGTLPLLILHIEALVNPFARISKQRPRRI